MHFSYRLRHTLQTELIKEVYDFVMMADDNNACLKKFTIAIRNMKQREKVWIRRICLLLFFGGGDIALFTIQRSAPIILLNGLMFEAKIRLEQKCISDNSQGMQFGQ